MKGYDVLIRDNGTGEVRRHHHPYPWDDEWIWTDGNYACDCNRAIFFLGASGHDEDGPIECGMGRYSCVAVFPDGRRIPLDDRAEEESIADA